MRNAMLKGLNLQTISNQIISKSTKVTSTLSDIPGHGVLKPVSSDYVPNYEEGLSQGGLQRELFVEEKISLVIQRLSTVTDSISRRITQHRKTILLSAEETNLHLPVSSIGSSLPSLNLRKS